MLTLKYYIILATYTTIKIENVPKAPITATNIISIL